eukprot:4121779-Pyramimonas_sp.AAC.1
MGLAKLPQCSSTQTSAGVTYKVYLLHSKVDCRVVSCQVAGNAPHFFTASSCRGLDHRQNVHHITFLRRECLPLNTTSGSAVADGFSSSWGARGEGFAQCVGCRIF